LGSEDQSLRSVQSNSLRDPISKITRAKWTVGATQVVEYLLPKCEALSSNPSPTQKKKFCVCMYVYVCMFCSTQENWKHIHTETYAWMFTVIVKKMETEISTNKSINKCNIAIYYLIIKKNEVLIHATTWMNFENMISERKSHTVWLH
jgi:hypothetical protein